MTLHPALARDAEAETLVIRPEFATPGEEAEIPRFAMPEHEMAASTAYQLVDDELMLDGNARLNLATFVTTWMEPEAERLIARCSDKNMIDKDEYPQTAKLEMRTVRMLAELWGAEDPRSPTGCSTTGSSEACMLGGMALKWRWRDRRRAAGKPTDRPNLVMGANVQVCWEKFCRYWDVEAKLVPVGPDTTTLTAETAAAACDENTIGVVAVLGSTFDGVYEPVAEIADALDRLQDATGLDVPMHVDGASGGFIAPFVDPHLEWDFRVPRVQSINASGHKFGLVYPGVGWVLWRDADALPGDLVFHVNYLGGDMPTFALNFSRPGAQVAAQYYNMIRLGRGGYRRIQQACRDTAMYLSAGIAEMGPFELVSDGSALPVFAFRVRDDVTDFTVYDVSDFIRMHGWLVPAYPMPENLQDTHVLRVVVRNGFSRDMGRMLLGDLGHTVSRLEKTGGAREGAHPARAGFHH